MRALFFAILGLFFLSTPASAQVRIHVDINIGDRPYQGDPQYLECREDAAFELRRDLYHARDQRDVRAAHSDYRRALGRCDRYYGSRRRGYRRYDSYREYNELRDFARDQRDEILGRHRHSRRCRH